jgi:hypothetical protein
MNKVRRQFKSSENNYYIYRLDEACLPLLLKLGFVKDASTVGSKPVDMIYETFMITS